MATDFNIVIPHVQSALCYRIQSRDTRFAEDRKLSVGLRKHSCPFDQLSFVLHGGRCFYVCSRFALHVGLFFMRLQPSGLAVTAAVGSLLLQDTLCLFQRLALKSGVSFKFQRVFGLLGRLSFPSCLPLPEHIHVLQMRFLSFIALLRYSVAIPTW